MPHSTHIIIRSDDIDANGHVQSARYLNYAQHARWIAVAQAGLSVRKLSGAGFSPVELNVSITYLRELVLGDEIDVESRFEFPSSKTIKVIQSIARRSDGAVAAEVTSLTGLMDLSERKLVDNAAAVWRSFLRQPSVVDLPPLDEELTSAG
ncbi:acyl-CoA thioesterase [Micromonospora gifhornensis]|uniref:Thioesterase n=1 Tax=Micromonospora gifhornensis TaxID=84594 RepID=A0ABQ4IJS9_9ACTN|nr:acyl-CoA thioesterase [Micromonospora gifhornensis]GIJ18096.1 thioesterase [Micromonospora gifhornensis]